MAIYASTDGTQNGDQLTVRSITDNYTVTARDLGTLISLNAGADKNITFPQKLGVGFWCYIEQLGTGKAVPTASSTTIHNVDGHTKTKGQYARILVTTQAVDVFIFSGDTV